MLYALKGQDARSTGEPPPPALVADLAASFQEAVVDVLVAKARQALDRTGLRRLGIGGGVAANGRFRERVAAMAAERGVELFIPPLSLCTDNAAMAGIALAKLAAGQVADLDVDVTPGLVRPAGERGDPGRPRPGRRPRNDRCWRSSRRRRSRARACESGTPGIGATSRAGR